MSNSESITSTSSERRYDVDWTRTFALGLLIIYHIIISFQPWANNIHFIKNADLLEWLWIPMAAINVWRIPILFMISGMGASFAMKHRNWKQFLLDRGVRIGIPYLVGFFLICPATVYSYHAYYKLENGYYPNEGHLWFLMNIMLYILYTIGILWTFSEYPDNPVIKVCKNALRRPWMIYAASIPLVLETVLVNPREFVSYTSLHGHIYGALCFVLGLLFVNLQGAFWNAIQRLRLLNLGMGVTLFLVRWLVFDISGAPRFLIAFESFCWMLAVFGYSAKYLNSPSRLLTYLSRAVYPMYIVHFPIQYAISYVVIPLEISPYAKLSILLVGIFGGSLAFYETVRRMPWIRPLFGLKFKQG